MKQHKMQDQTEDGGILLRIGEAAGMLGVSPRTVWRMIADGQLKAVHVRRCTRLLLAEVSKYLKQDGERSCA